jgi:hypothetical protein
VNLPLGMARAIQSKAGTSPTVDVLPTLSSDLHILHTGGWSYGCRFSRTLVMGGQEGSHEQQHSWGLSGGVLAGSRGRGRLGEPRRARHGRIRRSGAEDGGSPEPTGLGNSTPASMVSCSPSEVYRTILPAPEHAAPDPALIVGTCAVGHPTQLVHVGEGPPLAHGPGRAVVRVGVQNRR